MPNASQTDLKAILPLSPATFYILLALPDGPKHGYAIMKEVEQMTEGKITLGPGSLYGSIKRLLQDNMIVETDHRPIRALDDERRRYYALTDYGRQVLAGEVQRLASAVRLAQKKAVFNGTIE
ncbi:MAG TPA: PadR family transcriptional regulator [Anaerolineales bacterium]|jgi:DNA-binding PadR family transcriptional regulator|nr:PadR family transcriptional regulator [Anaerolineales bacterium]